MNYPDGHKPKVIKHIKTRRANKYHARKVTIDGITFDSKVESRYWYACKQAYLGNDAVEIRYHDSFEIVPAYKIGDRRHQARKYTPDFTIYEDGKLVKVIDVKGGRATMTDGSSMRINLFMYRYHIPVTIAKWDRKLGSFREEEK